MLKADVHGSVEALRDALLKLSTDAVKVDVLLSGVGAVTETRRDARQARDRRDRGRLPRAARAGGAPRRRRTGRRHPRLPDHLRGRDEVRKAMAGLLPPTISETFARPRRGAHRPSAYRASARSPAATSSEGMIRRGSIGAPAARRRPDLRGPGRLAQALQGRRARGRNSGFECGIGHRGLQRRQGR